MKGFDPFSTTNSLYGVFYTDTPHPQTSYTKEFTRPDMPFAFYNQTQNMQQAYFNRLGHLIGKKPNVTEEQRNLTESQFNVQGAVKAKQLQNQFEPQQNLNAYAPKKEERQSTFKKIGAQISNDSYHEPLLHYRPEATYKIPPFQKHLPYGYQPNLSPFQEYVTYAPGTNKVIGGTYLDTFDNYLPNVQRISQQQQQQQTYKPVTVEQVPQQTYQPPQQTYQPPVQNYPPVQAEQVPQQTYQPPVQDYPPVQAEQVPQQTYQPPVQQQTYQPPVQDYPPVQAEQVPPQPQQTYQTVTVEQTPVQQTYQPVQVEQVPPQFQEQMYQPPQEHYAPVTLEQVPQPQLQQTVTVEQQHQMPVMEQTYQPAQETVTLVHATQPENMEYRESIPPKHQVVYETTQEMEPLRPANVQGDYKIGSSLNASQGGLGPERTQVTYQQTGELEPLRPANVQGDYKIGSSLSASQGGMGGQLPQYTVVQQGEMEPLRAANVQGDYKIGSSYGQSGQKYVQNDISGLEPLRASNVRGDYKIGSSLMQSA